MKVKELVTNEKAIYALSNVDLEDAQLAWDLADQLEPIEKALDRYHKRRNELLIKYGEPDPEDKTKYNIRLADIETFNAEVEKLLEVNVSVKFTPIPIKQFSGNRVSASNVKAWRNLGAVIK